MDEQLRDVVEVTNSNCVTCTKSASKSVQCASEQSIVSNLLHDNVHATLLASTTPHLRVGWSVPARMKSPLG